jgi:hypothetical protein
MAIDQLNETEVRHLERVRADSLRLGDRVPYFGGHVRTVTDRGNGTVRVHFIARPGQERNGFTCYAGDLIHVLRAGWMRGAA